MNKMFTQPTGPVAKQTNKQAIARVNGITQDKVGYISNSTPIDAFTVLFEKVSQTTWKRGVATGVPLSWAVINNTLDLVTTSGSYTLFPAGPVGIMGYVTPEMYGAFGDGVHNDTLAMNAAKQFAIRAKLPLYLDGTYLIDEFVIESGLNVVGSGIETTVLKPSLNATLAFVKTEGVASADMALGATTQVVSGFSIKNLKIDGSSTYNSIHLHGMMLYGRKYEVRNIQISAFSGRGFYSSGYYGPAWDDPAIVPDSLGNRESLMESIVDNVKIEYCGEDGLYFNGPHDSIIKDTIVALNSKSNSGVYDGVFIGKNAGGTQLDKVHSWGSSHRKAFNIDGGYIFAINCIADDAHDILVHMNNSNITWMGGKIFGAVFGEPTDLNKNLKGVVLGSSGTSVSNVQLITSIDNAPKGAVIFDNCDSTKSSLICVTGGILPSLFSDSVGFDNVNAIPHSWSINIDITSAAAKQNVLIIPRTFAVPEGFKNSVNMAVDGDYTTGAYVNKNAFGMAISGQSVYEAGVGYVKMPVKNSPPTSTAWVAGMMYYDTAMGKLRVYNGTVWQDISSS